MMIIRVKRAANAIVTVDFLGIMNVLDNPTIYIFPKTPNNSKTILHLYQIAQERQLAQLPETENIHGKRRNVIQGEN